MIFKVRVRFKGEVLGLLLRFKVLKYEFKVFKCDF